MLDVYWGDKDVGQRPPWRGPWSAVGCTSAERSLDQGPAGVGGVRLSHQPCWVRAAPHTLGAGRSHRLPTSARRGLGQAMSCRPWPQKRGDPGLWRLCAALGTTPLGGRARKPCGPLGGGPSWGSSRTQGPGWLQGQAACGAWPPPSNRRCTCVCKRVRVRVCSRRHVLGPAMCKWLLTSQSAWRPCGVGIPQPKGARPFLSPQALPEPLCCEQPAAGQGGEAVALPTHAAAMAGGQPRPERQPKQVPHGRVGQASLHTCVHLHVWPLPPGQVRTGVWVGGLLTGRRQGRGVRPLQQVVQPPGAVSGAEDRGGGSLPVPWGR